MFADCDVNIGGVETVLFPEPKSIKLLQENFWLVLFSAWTISRIGTGPNGCTKTCKKGIFHNRISLNNSKLYFFVMEKSIEIRLI